MLQVNTISELRQWRKTCLAEGKRVAFVPTMGNLHDGHLTLVREARKHADVVIASIFVNPLQFGANEDLDSYPRTPEQDRAALMAEGVQCLFMPSVTEMYPRGEAEQTFVEVPGLGGILCGASRPGHFRGVATVVCRLFNLVQPDVAVFGKKDYQQLMVIRLMTADLGMPIDIIGVDTVRETDGLAMSSRNNYLDAAERQQAPVLYSVLRQLAECLQSQGIAGINACRESCVARLKPAGFELDYLELRRQADLAPPQANDTALVILVAARLGKTRLIDNLEVDLKLPA
ncbi:MAG: pantoate--beta-alanine ligase [Gammaproteobacteria bacterium]|nr:pantoate--beta-alanine ligase [Gammaproteobacteria bacterium]